MFSTTVTTDADAIYVRVQFTLNAYEGVPLDRKEVMGWGLPLKHAALAKRLVRAIEAGKVYAVKGVQTDVYGKSYLVAHSVVLGRTMNADLKRLGF
jgi:hypothetical protein